MNGPVRNRRRFFLLLAPLVAVSAVLPAGRSDAVEAETVTAAEIVAGLKTIQSAATSVAESAGKNTAKAQNAATGIEPVWSKIEATVKANKEDSYAAFEKAIDDIAAAAKAGDAAAGRTAADAFAAAVKGYAAEYPAGFAAALRTDSAAPAPATPAPAAPKAAAPEAKESSADRQAAAAPAPAAEAGSGTLARTGPHDGILALAGCAFGLGGLAVMGGARRRFQRV